MKRKMLLFTLALPVVLLQSAQAQVSSRLMSSSRWLSTGVGFSPSDSADYHYTGGRGGAMDLSATNTDMVSMANTPGMDYSDSRMWNFVGDSAYIISSDFQTFDANNNVSSDTWLMADGTPNTNMLYTYNASNMMTRMVSQSWNGTSWVSNTQHLFSYYPSGKLALDSVQTYNTLTSSWDMSGISSYFYDGSLNLVNVTRDVFSGGVPVHADEWTRTYTTAGQLHTTVYATWNGSGWVNSYMYTHDYDVTGRSISLLLQNYISATSTWQNNTLRLYSNFNSSSMPQTVVRQVWNNTGAGAWVNAMQYSYLYNSFNQVVFITGVSWNSTSGLYQYAAGDPVDNYYYELYNPTTVKSVAGNGVEANIYPVPAQNMLHIDLGWTEAQSATISIYDVTGNIVRQLSAPSAVKFAGTISVNDLASGTYFVKVNGEKNQVIKQIVVAH